MRSSKKARGRPRGRKAPHRPVLSIRVPEDLYEKIQTSARVSGRTVSQEAVWRAEQSYEWDAARETIQAWITEANRRWSVKMPVQQFLNYWGLEGVPAIEGEPQRWKVTEEGARKMLEWHAVRAIEKIWGKQS